MTLAATVGLAVLMRDDYTDALMFTMLAVVFAGAVALPIKRSTRRTGFGILVGVAVAAVLAFALFVALMARRGGSDARWRRR